MRRILPVAFKVFFLIFIAGQLVRTHGQTTSGTITTAAGTGTPDFCCDASLAIEANLAPQGVAVDNAGTIYVADSLNHRIRKIDVSSGNGIISTATTAVNSPSDVKIDSAGNVYIADPGLNQVFRFQPKGGGFTTLAGTGDPGFSGDGGLAIFAQLNSPSSVAIDASGNIYILDAGNSRIRKVASDTQVIQTIAGNGTAGFAGDGGPATDAQINVRFPAFPAGMAIDTFGYLYFSDSANGRVRRISPKGIIKTIAGGGAVAEDDTPATAALILEPRGIVLDADGTLFIADNGRHRIRRVNGAGVMTTVTGSDVPGFAGDGGPLLSAQLNYPSGIALDSARNLYIADEGNARVRKASLGIDVSAMRARLSDRLIFPQFANGQFADGTYYRSTLMISNPDASVIATCNLKLNGLTVNGFNSVYDIPPGSWISAATNGTEPFQSGYATLSCSSKVDASLIYSLYDAKDGKVSEATVFPSPAAMTNHLFLDTHEGARLGMAIANDSDQSVTYRVNAADDFGRPLPAATLSIAPRTARAAFLDEIIPVLPNTIAQVSITADVGLSVIGLRFSGKTFTTIPSTMLGPTANKSHVFPQYAAGTLPDGTYYKSTLFIATGPDGGDCRYQRRTSSGTVSTFNYSFSPGTWFTNQSQTSQPIESGYATLMCSDPVDAELLYSFYSREGVKLSEATVFSSPPAEVAQVLADGREGARLGLAIANDTDRAATYLIRVGDSNGNEIGRRSLSVGSRTSRAIFLDELLTVSPNNIGPVLVYSDSAPNNVIGIRFTGNVFTTIPSTNEPLAVGGLVKAGTSH